MNVTSSGARRRGLRREVLLAALLTALGAGVSPIATAQETPGLAAVGSLALRATPAEATGDEPGVPASGNDAGNPARANVAVGTAGENEAAAGTEADGAVAAGVATGTARVSGGGASGPTPWPTAARDLPRGIALTAADIAWADGAPDSAAPDQVGEGWVTRRVIAAGEPLRPPAVAPPSWVTRGEPVQLLYRAGPVEGRLRGTAMGTAAKGERVLVRIDARRRVEGVVVAPGLVQIQGGIR